MASNKMSDETIFAAALAKPAAQRSAFLAEACGEDAELRNRIDALLAAHANPDSIFDFPAQTEMGHSTSTHRLPERLGDFEILQQIGQGGMGIVYEARQISLNRRVALKVLSSGLGLTAKAVLRFRREAEAAAKLHHTNIVPIYATGEDGGVHFYAMELIEGPALDQVIRRLKEGPVELPNAHLDEETFSPVASLPEWVDEALACAPALSSSSTKATTIADSSSLSQGSGYFDAVARMMADVADALEHAHHHGVIHRDIKPSNLLLGPDGRLSVNDFGLARMLEQPGMTMTGEFVGSPLYMSPEQITAGRAPLDHRTDIYSLGATLYELLTQQPPFPGNTRDQVIGQILHKEPSRPRRLNRRVPADLETICLKAIERDPDRRYQTAEALAADLRRYVNRHAISARRIGPLGRGLRWARRHRGLAASLSGVVVLGFAALFFAVRSFNVERQSIAIKRELQMQSAKEDALEAALHGDLDAARQHIAEAQLHGAELAWVELLDGQVELFYGRNDRAIQHLTRATELSPESVVARAMLADACLTSGQWFAYLNHMAILDTLSLDESALEELLFVGRARFMLDSEASVEMLSRVVARRPSFVPYVFRAHSRVFRALDLRDIDTCLLAIRDTETAMEFNSQSPLAHGTQLYARLAAADLLVRQGRRDEADQQLAQAAENVKTLEREPGYFLGCFWRGHFFLAKRQYSAAIDAFRSFTDRGELGYAAEVISLCALQTDRVDDVLALLDGMPQPHDISVERARIAMLGCQPGGLGAARSLCDQLTTRDDWTLEEDWAQFVLLDETTKAQAYSQQRLVQIRALSPEFDSAGHWQWRRAKLLFEAGQLEDQDLLRAAGTSSWKLGNAHNRIAFKHLSDGDRVKALESFRKSVDVGVFHSGMVNWSRGTIALMERDPNWPPWLARKANGEPE